MKVAYHVDDEMEDSNSFGIIEVTTQGNNIDLNDVRLKISKNLTNINKQIAFPSLITVNKISVISANIIENIEIDQVHSFFIRNLTGQDLIIKNIQTTGDNCSLISIHGFDLSNTHVSAISDFVKFDNCSCVFPIFNDSRIGLISFVFKDIFHFNQSCNTLRVKSSLVGKIHIQNLCIGTDDSYSQTFELLDLKDGTVVDILNIQYVDFHSEFIKVEIALDKMSKLLNIEAEDDTKLKLQK